MIPLTADQTPLLPLSDPAGDWMIGVVERGVIVQYMEKDKAVLVEWEDIARLGLAEPVAAQEVEINGPTKAD